MEAKETITTTLVITSVNQNNGIIQLLPPTPKSLPSEATKIAESWEIQNFKAYSYAKSINVAPLPQFELEDTETDRLIKSLDVEWNSPRIQLNLYVGSPGNWTTFGSISLLNVSGYPYRVYDLLELYAAKQSSIVGTNSSFGVAIENAGYGLLSSFDKIAIYCDYLRTISYFVNQQIITNVTTPEVIVNNPVEINNNINGVGSVDDNDEGEDSDTGNDNNNEGDEMPLTTKTANYTVTGTERILCTNTELITITLPESPAIGTEVEIYGANNQVNIVVAGNGVIRQIEGNTFIRQECRVGGNYAHGGRLIFTLYSPQGATGWTCGTDFYGVTYD